MLALQLGRVFTACSLTKLVQRIGSEGCGKLNLKEKTNGNEDMDGSIEKGGYKLSSKESDKYDRHGRKRYAKKQIQEKAATSGMRGTMDRKRLRYKDVDNIEPCWYRKRRKEYG